MNNDVRLIFDEYKYGSKKILRDGFEDTVLDTTFVTNFINGEYYGVMTYVQFIYKYGTSYDIKIISENFLRSTPGSHNPDRTFSSYRYISGPGAAWASRRTSSNG